MKAFDASSSEIRNQDWHCCVGGCIRRPPVLSVGAVAVVLVAIAIYAGTGCATDAPPARGSTAPGSTTAPSDAERGAYAGYFWALSPDRRLSLAHAIQECKLGDDAAAVIARTGTPDQDEAGDQMELIPRQHRHRLLGFVVARFREGLSTEGKDQWVDLWFTADNKLEMVRSTFPGVTQRVADDALDPSPMRGWWKIWASENDRAATTRPAAQRVTTKPGAPTSPSPTTARSK